MHGLAMKTDDGGCRQHLWDQRRSRVLVIFSFLLVGHHAFAAGLPIHYTVSLAHAAEHMVSVKISVPAGSNEREFQLPVWNALYQVRDFSQYVSEVRARSTVGQALAVRKLDKSRWEISGGEGGVELEYQIFSNQRGPYDAQLNLQHAFFNLA